MAENGEKFSKKNQCNGKFRSLKYRFIEKFDYNASSIIDNLFVQCFALSKDICDPPGDKGSVGYFYRKFDIHVIIKYNHKYNILSFDNM